MSMNRRTKKTRMSIRRRASKLSSFLVKKTRTITLEEDEADEQAVRKIQNGNGLDVINESNADRSSPSPDIIQELVSSQAPTRSRKTSRKSLRQFSRPRIRIPVPSIASRQGSPESPQSPGRLVAWQQQQEGCGAGFLSDAADKDKSAIDSLVASLRRRKYSDGTKVAILMGTHKGKMGIVVGDMDQDGEYRVRLMDTQRMVYLAGDALEMQERRTASKKETDKMRNRDRMNQTHNVFQQIIVDTNSKYTPIRGFRHRLMSGRHSIRKSIRKSMRRNSHVKPITSSTPPGKGALLDMPGGYAARPVTRAGGLRSSRQGMGMGTGTDTGSGSGAQNRAGAAADKSPSRYNVGHVRAHRFSRLSPSKHKHKHTGTPAAKNQLTPLQQVQVQGVSTRTSRQQHQLSGPPFLGGSGAGAAGVTGPPFLPSYPTEWGHSNSGGNSVSRGGPPFPVPR